MALESSSSITMLYVHDKQIRLRSPPWRLMLLKVSRSGETMREDMGPGMAVDRLQKELLIGNCKYIVGPMPPDQQYHVVAESQK